MKELRTEVVENRIISSSSFIKTLRKVVYRMFDVDPAAIECKKIYIDLNSCLSVMFHSDEYNTDECKEELQNILETFMNIMLANKVQLIFLFTVFPSQAHTDVYPEWCKNRYERVNIMKSVFLKQFLIAIKEYSEKNNSIKLVNTKKVHPALVVYNAEYRNKKKFLVLSKDVLFQTMSLKHCSVYTGIAFIDMENPNRELPDDMDLSEAEALLPYALAISGSSRDEFPGVKLYGPFKASKYCNKYKIEIKLGLDHPLKEHADKFSVLFDIHKLLNINKQDIVVI